MEYDHDTSAVSRTGQVPVLETDTIRTRNEESRGNACGYGGKDDEKYIKAEDNIFVHIRWGRRQGTTKINRLWAENGMTEADLSRETRKAANLKQAVNRRR